MMCIFIKHYQPDMWRDLSHVRARQLIEAGVRPEDISISSTPEQEPAFDRDLHRIAQVYGPPRGGFWLAYVDRTPAGYVGAQALGAVIELRRMFVNQAMRRRGIGRLLCGALIEHAAGADAEAIELWTAAAGPGRALYTVLGFTTVAQPGAGFESVSELTDYVPKAGEVRMRLALAAH